MLVSSGAVTAALWLSKLKQTFLTSEKLPFYMTTITICKTWRAKGCQSLSHSQLSFIIIKNKKIATWLILPVAYACLKD